MDSDDLSQLTLNGLLDVAERELGYRPAASKGKRRIAQMIDDWRTLDARQKARMSYQNVDG
jgi:hypothetical protein